MKIADNVKKYSEKEFRGYGWNVNCVEGEYLFNFLSREMLGREKLIKITKNEYLSLIEGKIKPEEVCDRYGVA